MYLCVCSSFIVYSIGELHFSIPLFSLLRKRQQYDSMRCKGDFSVYIIPLGLLQSVWVVNIHGHVDKTFIYIVFIEKNSVQALVVFKIL